jgi:mannose-6-phosphate isomerase-like protein (cupin superfamily)
MVARGPDQVKTAPANAVKANIRVHALGGMTFREVTFPKGAKFMTPKGPMDTVAYVVKGRMKVNLGGVLADVGPGDSWRKISVQPSSYEIIDEAVILETDAKPEDRK